MKRRDPLGKRFVSSEKGQRTEVQHTKPCNDCPWRRNAVPGWTGQLSPEQWTWLANGDGVIFCHQLIPHQCAGAAIFRANICKVPRTDEALRLPQEKKKVFAWPTEFIAYHTTEK